MSVKRLGCWIVVFERSSERYRNHYVAKRLVTSDEYVADKGLFSKIFGLNEINEGMFFLGKFMKTFNQLKDEYKLTPEKHIIKIVEAEGYVFPKILKNAKFKEFIQPYTAFIPLIPLGILDNPIDFTVAVVLSFSFCLMIYAIWKVIDKYV